MGAKSEVFAKQFEAPPMTAEQLVTRGLLTHIDEHVGSIRKPVGN
jgi:hypothetical protein